MNYNDIYKILRGFTEDQILLPEGRAQTYDPANWTPGARLLYQSMIKIVSEYREGL